MLYKEFTYYVMTTKKTTNKNRHQNDIQLKHSNRVIDNVTHN